MTLLDTAEVGQESGQLDTTTIAGLMQLARDIAWPDGEAPANLAALDVDGFAALSLPRRRAALQSLRAAGVAAIRARHPTIKSPWQRLAAFTGLLVMAAGWMLIAVETGRWSPLDWTKYRLGPLIVHDQDPVDAVSIHTDALHDPLRLDGKPVAEGIRVRGPASVEVEVLGRATRLSGTCAAQRGAPGRCRLLAEDTLLYESPILDTRSKGADFSVEIPSRRRLILQITREGPAWQAAEFAWVKLRVP